MEKFFQVAFEVIIVVLGAIIMNLLWKIMIKPFLTWMLTPVRRMKFFQRENPAA